MSENPDNTRDNELLTVRMPTELRDWIREQAGRDRRSQSATVVHLLERVKEERGIAATA